MGKMQELSALKQAVDLVTRALSRVKSLRTLVKGNEGRPNPIQEKWWDLVNTDTKFRGRDLYQLSDCHLLKNGLAPWSYKASYRCVIWLQKSL
jgi:hypothetical protein